MTADPTDPSDVPPITGAAPVPPPSETAFAAREAALARRETHVGHREASADRRDAALQADAITRAGRLAHNFDLREANQHLLIATLHADGQRDAAELVRARQAAFLGLLAQDLRSPLAPIGSALALLAQHGPGGPGSPAQLAMHAVVQQQVNQMLQLVELLLAGDPNPDPQRRMPG